MRFDGEEVVIVTVGAAADIVVLVTVVVVVDKIVVKSGVVILLLGKLLSCCCSVVWSSSSSSWSFVLLQYPYQPSNSFIADSAYSYIQNNKTKEREREREDISKWKFNTKSLITFCSLYAIEILLRLRLKWYGSHVRCGVFGIVSKIFLF